MVQTKSQKAEISNTSGAPVVSDLPSACRLAVSLLNNYAAFDDQIGHVEDAAYTRARIAEIEAAIRNEARS